MSKIAFLINRLIKNYDAILKDIQNTFAETDYQLYFSDFSGHLVDLAQKALKDGKNTIITVGGDGTHNEVINGVLAHFKIGNNSEIESYDLENLKKIRLGLYPAGTGNDFSKSINIKPNALQLKNEIANGKSRLLDLGWTSFTDKQNKPTNRFFINITDVGMGGEVARKLENKIPLLSNKTQYAIRIVSTFLTYKKASIQAKSENYDWKGQVMNFIVANGKWFGNGLGVAPDAVLDDGFFEIAILGDIGLLDYLKHLDTVKKGEKVIHPEVNYNRFKEITITSGDGSSVPIDMDGEFVGYAPLTLKNIPQTINFIC
ncbi:MAG: YegS/Rv2252/BmrU family lipid kinase [Bacteroidetes bacterium]|nr:YegS/Rv2252/BmrU family lipid kinase [Bacteroidota bacterium]MBK7140222.1 YegS/Rv2252/BmrU family lipid kinase [Bacteroidota bacterium]MBK8672163.1 YegS/Rv2252/BmrU family lipid kinase [Bacteroidota bacterium]MBL0079648.1 YegS/Rv2252/BmrU family lipid kinase [Bacteroidota bacterium]MBP7257095.1 YegS/Rv2252/BmrU family lipid kinase [Chitinophagales bacterium]